MSSSAVGTADIDREIIITTRTGKGRPRHACRLQSCRMDTLMSPGRLGICRRRAQCAEERLQKLENLALLALQLFSAQLSSGLLPHEDRGQKPRADLSIVTARSLSEKSLVKLRRV
jgi:hypothetical protein